jgi:hypothetical protein
LFSGSSSNGAPPLVLASAVLPELSELLCADDPGELGPFVEPGEVRVVDARYCPIGCSIRPQPESAMPSGQIATIARSSASRMGCLGRSPQSLFGQAGQRYARWMQWVAWAAAMSAFWCVGTERLHAQDVPDTAEAQEAAQQDAPDAGVSGLEGQLTLDSGATCLERKRLISRIVRWRETENVDATLRVQVWGDPKIATRVFFSVARDGVDPAERTLANAPSDCDELHSAVALSIALAIDSLFASRDPAPLTAALEDIQAKQEAKKLATPPYQRSWEVGLLVGATLSVVPSLAMAALPRVHFAVLPWFAVALEGIVTRAARVTFNTGPESYDATVLAAGLDACAGGETAERMSFYVCAGARIGGFSTQGYGFGSSELVTRPWWAIAASSQARAWIFSSFGIGIGVEALYSPAERVLLVTADEGAGRTRSQSVPRFGLAVSGGPVFRFF